jgi:hypothetical protein
MLKKSGFIALFLIFQLSAQTIQFDFASLSRRDSFYNQLKLKMSEAMKPENFRNIAIMDNGLWAAELMKDRDSSYKVYFSKLIDSIQTFKYEVQRQILQTAFALWKGEFYDPVFNFAHITNDPKLFAMCVNYINLDPDKARYFMSLTLAKFHEKQNHPIIEALLGNLKIIMDGRPALPPLKDLLEYQKDSSVFRMYMLARHDRNYNGMLVFRKASGEFLRDSSGAILTLPYFAMSLPNMPGYITNGNSPQGCFSVMGAYGSSAKLIGPTFSIRLFMPSETKNTTFYNNYKVNGKDDRSLYLSLFPESWREYFPVMETYLAGKAGRNDIVMHGSTADLRYYTDEPFYPNVPTHGCLSGQEVWDENGYRFSAISRN